MIDKLPPELRTLQGVMDMVFGALNPSAPRPASAESIATSQRMARAEMILDWEQRGLLDPNCPGCREFYESPRLPNEVFAPRHKNYGCDSGGRPHCTCPTCWG